MRISCESRNKRAGWYKLLPMKIAFEYEKWSTIQALRFHFLSRPEIRVLIIVSNIYTIVAAVLLYLKYIRPEPFLLGVLIWAIVMGTYWFLLPYYLYAGSRTFREKYVFMADEGGFLLENEQGTAEFEWKSMSHYLESPGFVHLYFNPRSFFLIPKPVTADNKEALIALLNNKIRKG